MTPENKVRAKDLVIKFLKEKHPTYPDVELEVVIENIKDIYTLLLQNELITKEAVPPQHFQHIVVDLYRSAKIAQEMENFF